MIVNSNTENILSGNWKLFHFIGKQKSSIFIKGIWCITGEKFSVKWSFQELSNEQCRNFLYVSRKLMDLSSIIFF